MPTYEYECTRCGTITSEFKPMSAPRRQRCPACRGKVELLISGGLGVVFKGQGFYVNDSRASSRSRPGSTEGGSVAPKEADGTAEKKTPAPADTAGTQGSKGKDKD